MYRNLYDTEVTTWSPQGRLHQVEYAMEGVRLGTCGVGIRSDTHVVISGLKRSLSQLAGYNAKLMKIDDHIGLTFSGITADAKYLANYMRKECLGHKYVCDSPHAVGPLVAKIGSKSQLNTQQYTKRPYGCGMIIGGVDATGPHLFETCPSGNFGEYYAIAFGSRSQAAKTYLEKNYKSFSQCSRDELIYHAVRALHCSVAQDQQLTTECVSIGVVSKDEEWKELTPAELQVQIDRMPTSATAEEDKVGGLAGGEAAPEEGTGPSAEPQDHRTASPADREDEPALSEDLPM